MKFLVMLIASFTTFSAFADDTSPQVVPVAYKNIYIPNGFDSNDSVQFTADGVFANACYKIAAPQVAVEEAAKVITVQAQAYLYAGLCAQVLIPFQQVVHLGIIKTPGTYKIVDAAGTQIGQIDIKPATSALEDDFFYAPVQKISVAGGNKLTMRVEFNDSCMKMKEVRVEKQQNVIVILPIVEVAQSNGAACAQGYFPWTEEVNLGPLPAHQRYLIHVRASGSQALNEILVN